MLRRDGETFFFGTAIGDSYEAARKRAVLRQNRGCRQQAWQQERPGYSRPGRPRATSSHGYHQSCQSVRPETATNRPATAGGLATCRTTAGLRGMLGNDGDK